MTMTTVMTTTAKRHATDPIDWVIDALLVLPNLYVWHLYGLAEMLAIDLVVGTAVMALVFRWRHRPEPYDRPAWVYRVQLAVTARTHR